MATLAKWEGKIYKVDWLGEIHNGAFKGQRRARLVPFYGGIRRWVNASEIEIVDFKDIDRKAQSAGKD